MRTSSLIFVVTAALHVPVAHAGSAGDPPAGARQDTGSEATAAARLAEADLRLRRGEPVAALEALAGLPDAGPCRGLQLLLLGRAQLATGDAEAALASADASSAAPGEHGEDARWLRAEALSALGRAEAAGAFETLAESAATPQRRGQALVRTAELLESGGESLRAAKIWRRVALELTAWAPEDALRRADDLAAKAGTPLPALDPAQRLAFARALRAANLHERAVVELRRAERGLKGAQLVATKLARARSHYDARQNDDARAACAEVFQLAPTSEEAAQCRLVAARAAWRVDDGKTVLAHVDAALKQPLWRRSEVRPDLLLVKGNYFLERGRHDEAVSAFAKLLAESPRSSKAGEARWRIAWCRMHQGRPLEAAVEFEKLASEQQGGDLERIGALWAAIARERAGEDATTALASVAARWPWTYQGEQARAMLKERLDEAQLAAERARWDASGEALPLPPPPVLPGEAGRRYELLRDAGLHAWALPEIESLAAGRAADESFAFELARARARAGKAAEADVILRKRFSQALARPSRRSPRELWEIAYPLPLPDLVLEQSRRHGIEPALCAAIIRSESGWDPAARSWADARGLMQLVPATAAKIAAAEGLAEWRADHLFDPDVNVALGARHLADLVIMFEGDLDPAIASYNAGEDKVRQWWAEFDAQGVPAAERVERIPYRETRQYVRRVREAMGWYAWLFEPEPETGAESEPAGGG